ncbi:MAG: hypothetical protein JWL93_1213 [Hyphomicrobiales bacterium]|jgi:hypothetical protein|nr:hypothetical protein [Hyphomicrobiales bacterium]
MTLETRTLEIMTPDTAPKARLSLLGTAALAIVLAAAVPAPAFALDDDGSENVFSAVLGLVGIGGDKDGPNIEYRERAPIVVPPNRQALPQPLPPAAQRNGAWPQDQEVVRRRQAAAERGRARVDEVWNPVSQAELAKGRAAPGTASRGSDNECNDPLARVCNAEKTWSDLRNARSNSDSVADLVPGQEPSRSWLTEPPPGYRKPTKAQKYVAEPRGQEVDVTDARAQVLDERRRRAEQ